MLGRAVLRWGRADGNPKRWSAAPHRQDGGTRGSGPRGRNSGDSEHHSADPTPSPNVGVSHKDPMPSPNEEASRKDARSQKQKRKHSTSKGRWCRAEAEIAGGPGKAKCLGGVWKVPKKARAAAMRREHAAAILGQGEGLGKTRRRREEQDGRSSPCRGQEALWRIHKKGSTASKRTEDEGQSHGSHGGVEDSNKTLQGRRATVQRRKRQSMNEVRHSAKV